MRILREPLVHFLVLGAVVYVAANRGESTRYQIDAGADQRARLARTYYEQYGAPPTSAQLDLAVDEYVRNEILYREGLALGLEQDDEIVRRRVVQKIEFVNEDLDAVAEPEGVERYFAQHRDRYDTEPAVSFEQVFFSSDRGGDAVARKRAESSLPDPARSGAKDADPFAEGHQFQALTRTGANSLFGDTNLSAELFTSPTGQWAGPFKSAYGWHLVRITDRQPSHHAELAAVRPRVQADYTADLRARANAEAFRKIAAKYRVVTNTPSSTASDSPAKEETASHAQQGVDTAAPTNVAISAPAVAVSALDTSVAEAPSLAAAGRPRT